MVAIKPHVVDFLHRVLLCLIFLSLKDKNTTLLQGTGVLFGAQDHLK